MNARRRGHRQPPHDPLNSLMHFNRVLGNVLNHVEKLDLMPSYERKNNGQPRIQEIYKGLISHLENFTVMNEHMLEITRDLHHRQDLLEHDQLVAPAPKDLQGRLDTVADQLKAAGDFARIEAALTDRNDLQEGIHDTLVKIQLAVKIFKKARVEIETAYSRDDRGRRGRGGRG